MPKMKPHKGLKKRVRLTGKGKIKRRKAFAGHLMSGKSGKRCRNLRRGGTAPAAVAAKIREALKS